MQNKNSFLGKGWAFPQNSAIMIIPPACLIMKKTSGKA